MTSKPAIIGYGHTGFSRKPGPAIASLAREAVIGAVQNADLTLDQVDGMILGQSDVLNRAELTLAFRHSLALGDLGLFSVSEGKGTTVVQTIQQAVMAINAGLCRNVVCVFSDAPIKADVGGGQAFARPSKVMNINGWEETCGGYGAIGAYALAASVYLSRFGLGDEAFGHYAVACRKWAQLNPLALFREDLTIDAYVNSRNIVSPLRLLDCAVPVNGAVAFVVSASDSLLPEQKPVYVHGMGQGHGKRSALLALCTGERSGALCAANAALSMARVGHADVDLCQIYDAFSFSGLYALEDFGFCQPGGAVEFVACGNTSPGGVLPVNTGGGHLSGFYLQGATPLLEAVMQAQGQAGERQIENNDVTFVSNSGGCLEYHATLILSPHERLN